MKETVCDHWYEKKNKPEVLEEHLKLEVEEGAVMQACACGGGRNIHKGLFLLS